MEKIQVDNYVINKISKEEVAEYIEQVLSSNFYEDIISKMKNRNSAISFYRDIGKILPSYISATGDLNIATAQDILQELASIKDIEDKDFNLNDFYSKYIIPKITRFLGYSDKPFSEMSINEMIRIENHINITSKNNRFYTHSFSGALYEKINEDGLNINNEMFIQEYDSLRKLSGDSPFKTGQLFFCELGEHSFQYATKSPERLSMILTKPINNQQTKQREDETLQEYFIRCLEEQLTHSNLSNEDKEVIRKDGLKLINFYYGQQKSCIAVMNADNVGYSDTIAPLYTNMLSFKTKNIAIFRQDEEMNLLYMSVLESLKNREFDCIDKLDRFREIFNSKYSNNKTLNELLEHTFNRTVIEFCTNNVSRSGHGDGYVAKNGIIERDKISIANFKNIHDLYSVHQKTNNGGKKFSMEETLKAVELDIVNLRNRASLINQEIEKYMSDETIKRDSNYQNKLNELLQKRDELYSQSEQLMEYKRTLESNIKHTRQTERKNKISQIEKLLGIQITDQKGYTVENGMNVPKIELKTKQELVIEQGSIFRKIDELYDEGEIDLKTKQDIQNVIRSEYERMINNAPQVSVTNQKTNEESQNNNTESAQENIDAIPEEFKEIYDMIFNESVIREMREKYGYFEMSDEEKEFFDDKLENTMTRTRYEEMKKGEDSLADLRREAWKKLKMRLQSEPMIDLETLIRQEEFGEIENEQIEEVEKTGRRIY